MNQTCVVYIHSGNIVYWIDALQQPPDRYVEILTRIVRSQLCAHVLLEQPCKSLVDEPIENVLRLNE